MSLSKSKFWFILAGLLLLPALLINLGLQVINDDEAIRTIVAIEMDFSGDYIVPTWNGVEYRSKPPVYNWVLVATYKILGGFSEWNARIPNILFLLGFGFVIYFFSKKHFSREYSVLNALLFITCGRILFWDSMLSYIDILYSLVTFSSFMLIFHLYEKKKFWQLFLWSYVLAGIGFLLKGFPSILFQGITIVVYFVYKKNWKKLFSLEHLVGILAFVLLVGSYYLSYIQRADLSKTMDSLLYQATLRTAMEDRYNVYQLISHIFTYPLENIYHFLPWSIMVIYLFQRGIIGQIKKEPFILFCALIFISNILVYWFSIEVYPRYILMLMPLVFSIFLYFHKIHYDKESIYYKIYYRIHQVLFVVLFLTPIIALVNTMHVDIPLRYVKLVLGLLSLGFIFYFFTKYKHIRLITFICAILVARIFFNWFFIPERHQGDKGVECREQAIELGKKYKDLPVNIYNSSNIDLTSSVYIANERGKITPRSSVIQEEGVTIFDTARAEMPLDIEIIDKICVREGQQTLFLIRKKK